ncbi:hypothetical protein C5E07_03970 [Pseudoclavibacter sp. RFBJ3]|uniref:DUF4307 domain-containing protein n=1 Tax=unclassified Pseudoclavibacter TaxID=2615177 RepID=UPI000CE8A2CC|nr:MULTISPECIES: DUF4307 domain-containing protein [unclassified Pseudoclavibacter]MBF4549815.1 DUF4307 domain-containing protein [Pseudoclavibacter sp. VKM Ac-2888]PPF39695.1 hypothetical protein C5E05_00265 [Pseudoclavibacter sp. AY1H1]PPF76229.1 hypothetical protein C5B99_10360 [Pseudoclavibacter sp. Z016]PPF84687.1 hypothetical protein C5C12_04675 [Pseudoclavibacter sp. RFBJ5]PPF93690.1 hypothetical protein C5E07_03970 [Pseudoclavibacter sp. RFBJ3]
MSAERETRADTAATSADLVDRYGARAPRSEKKPERWIWMVVGIFVIAVVAFWATTTVGPVSSSAIRADTVRFSIVDDANVSFDYRITAPAGTEATCAIEIRDEQQAVVGWDIVDVPATDEASQVLNAQVRTTKAGTTALVKECWLP